MTVVLTNDDGIDAPGLQALAKAVNRKAVIVAPQQHQSGCSHQVTTNSLIQIERRSETAFGVAGMPADCVRIALAHLCQGVELVLSGINAGGNLGVDAYISGTVAAVREAAFYRVPAIAVSHYRKPNQQIDWNMATRWTAEIIPKLLDLPCEPGTFWNVNLPHLKSDAPMPEMVLCQPCTQPLPAQYRVEGDSVHYVGDYASRDRTPGSDVDVCFSGRIAVTQIRL